MIRFLITLGFLLVGACQLQAADAVKPGKLELYATWSAVSLELPYQGDDNHSAQASFVWRRAGEDRWRAGVDMTLDRRRRLIWASIWPLEQGDAIEVHVTVKDNDGGGADIKASANVKKMNLAWEGFTEKYVAPSGDDAGPGTKTQPFRTLAHAAKTAGPGTVVYVMSGVYREGNLLTGVKGTEARPIVFAAAPGHTPILDSSIVLEKGKHAWKDAGQGVFVSAADFDGGYVTQDGLRMFHYPGVAELQADKLSVKRAWYFDDKKKLLYVRTGKHDPAGHEYQLSRHSYALHLAGSKHVIVRGFTIRNYGAALIRLSDSAQGCLILDNKLHNAPGAVFMKGPSTHANAIWKNDIFEPGMDDVSWQANYAYGYANQAIYCDKAGRGNSFCHNRIHDHFDLISVESWKNPDKLEYNRDCDVMFNDLWNSGDDAIEVDGGGVNLRIHGNTIRHCFSAISLAPIERGPVYVTFNTASFLNLLFKFNVGGCTSHGPTYVYHNTGYCLISGADGGTGLSFPPNIPCTNKVLKNNIVISNEWSIRAGKTGYELDGNCYYHVPGRPPRRFQWDKKTFATLALFQQATGQEKHGLYTDPKLKNIPDAGKIPSPPNMAELPPRAYRPAARAEVDLHLAPDSPCLKGAVSLSGINDGTPTNRAAMGAFPYGQQ